jgi:Flp pilus assembly protein TadD
LWVVFAVVLLACAVHIPTIRYGFVWDDHYLIEQNEYLSRTNPGDIFTHELFYNPGYHDTQLRLTYYRPLVNLSYFLERKIWGVNPLGYHLTNVLLHAGIAILLVLILFELFHSTWLAAIGGILFALHPALNSIVCFLANRTYLLAMAGIMISFFCLVRGRRHRNRLLPIFFGFGLLGALLSQEAAFAYVVIALGWLVLRRAEYRRLSVWLTAALVPCVCYVILRFGIAHVPLPPESISTALQHPLAILNYFGQQVLTFFDPFLQKVAYAANPAMNNLSGYTFLALAVLIVPIVVILRSYRGKGQTPPGGLRQGSDPFFRIQTSLGYVWAVALLLPFAHLTTLGPSGRILYLPASGILIFLIASASRVKSPSRILRNGALVVCGIVALTFAFQTVHRNPVWRDENTLNEVKVQEAPDSPEAHDNLGVKLREAGDVPGAIREHRRAIELKPDFSTAHNNLGSALFEAGNLGEAVQEYRTALRLEPDFAMAHNNLGVALQQTGKYDSAEIEYRQALRLEPAMALALNNLGEILMRTGKTDSAAAEFRSALLTQPGYALAHYNLGLALQRLGHPNDARREFEQTLKIMPDFRAAQDALRQLQ